MEDASEKQHPHPAIVVALTLLAVAVLAAFGLVGYSMYQKRVEADEFGGPGTAQTTAPLEPIGGTPCGDSVRFKTYAGSLVTSCPFAVSVGQAADSQAGSSFGVQAYSPTTGKSYHMRCTDVGGGTLRCEGGNNAVVILVPV